jgi:hypothetical protein
VSATAQEPAAATRSDDTPLLEIHADAGRLVEEAEAAREREVLRKLLASAAERLEALAERGAEGASLPGPLADELRDAAAELRALAEGRRSSSAFSAERYRSLLERTRDALAAPGGIPLGLTFQGSFSQSRVEEPVYGGHASAMGPAPMEMTAADPVAVGVSPARFEERAPLETRTYCGGPGKDHILESGGNGLALFDYDADGRLDVYLVTAAELTADRRRIPHRNALYRNLGGWRFEDVSEVAGVDAAAWGNGACAGDFDGDGHLDLYVTNWGPNLLFRNNGDGTFEERAAAAGIRAGGWSTGCSFLDADADGDLDLYVARYVEVRWEEVVAARRSLTWRDGPSIMVGPQGLPGEADLYFENRGDGTFTEVAAERGLADHGRAYGFGVVSTDYDGDGWVDLFVANDSNPNFLYRNLGDGSFESVGLISGVAVAADGRSQAGMGATAGDYDGDGRLDLVVTNFAQDTNALSRNVDGGAFEDASAAAGLAASTFRPMGWGIAFLDADLDGRLDLFFANGHIFSDIEEFPDLGEGYGQENQLFLNVDGRFRDVSAVAGAGLRVRKTSRGVAVGDLDDDGDPDLVVSNVDDVPTLLENVQSTGNHWVGFRIEAASGNRFAIGARVTLEAGGRRQVREVRSGEGFLSQSDLRTRFGLGEYPGPVDVEVTMPGGARWRWSGLEGDRLHVLRLEEGRRVG